MSRPCRHEGPRCHSRASHSCNDTLLRERPLASSRAAFSTKAADLRLSQVKRIRDQPKREVLERSIDWSRVQCCGRHLPKRRKVVLQQNALYPPRKVDQASTEVLVG